MIDPGTNKPNATPQGRHRRSRYGCRNCKIRKLKCDETKPHCKKCSAYGVRCNFEHNVQDLQSITEKKSENAPAGKRLMRLRPVISEAIWSSNGSTSFLLDAQDQALFKRYRDRTIFTIGGLPMVDTWGNQTLQAAFEHPCLMHGLLAVAAVHDRHLGLVPCSRRTLRELHHWSRCTILFAEMLSCTIKEEFKDPCWATAATLGILTFASTDVDAAGKKQPWPLGAADSSDLEWLRLGAGKMRLWQLLNPLRPQSAGAFEALLRDKDPVALILLCMWYDSARRAKWWIEMRAKYEYAAIRSYLQLHYGEHIAVKRLPPD
ncbi:hypothetical protein LLEC1_04238 [Akanthomyces lecanii]|uniref:Zn(2)-C6 fungal-type domain-containing protein n=1 Tax=Cordyceps confragosa TaxID=2714763 RepID=A0A179I4W5_CORDF|nr:hypothetical protein LLEC1_04238 [Akanthomyces lecanii]